MIIFRWVLNYSGGGNEKVFFGGYLATPKKSSIQTAVTTRELLPTIDMLFIRQSIVLISTLASACGRGSRGGYGSSINRSTSSASASEVLTIVAEKESNRNSTIPFVSLTFVQDTGLIVSLLSHSLSCPFLMVHSWRLRR